MAQDDFMNVRHVPSIQGFYGWGVGGGKEGGAAGRGVGGPADCRPLFVPFFPMLLHFSEPSGTALESTSGCGSRFLRRFRSHLTRALS